MKIAQIAPLFESVPPKKYGGTERVVYNLTEALIQSGHDVTLFASGDSVSNAKLMSPCAKSLRLYGGYEYSSVPHTLMFEQIRRLADDFDILHFHTDYMHFPVARSLDVPTLTTLHGRLDIPELIPLYREYSEIPLISISNSQRQPMSWANWKNTIYHGLPKHFFQLGEGKGGYAAFLGRISPEKRPDRAIEIATRAGIHLKIAAKVDAYDRNYYEKKIKPMIEQSPNVEFIGEISDEQKAEFLGNASVLLFPIDWPEPFGLVMIEAMAHGTPVISFRNGSAPEVITDGITGFLVNSVEEAVEKSKLIPSIDRAKCQKRCAELFSIENVISSYLRSYEDVIEEFHGRKRGYFRVARKDIVTWKI